GFVEMAIKASEKSGSLNDLGNCYKVLADLHHLVNEYDKALVEIQTSLAYYQKTGYKSLEGVYDLFGQLHSARGEYKQALTYELMALKIANANYNGGLQVCQIENNVGLTLYKLNDPGAALPHFKNALDIAEKERDFEAVYGLTSHVVEAYIAMKQPDEGLAFLKKIERTVQKPTTDRFETKGYIDKTYLNLYTILKYYDAGRPYCDRLIIRAEEKGLDVFKVNGYYEEIIKYLTATGNYPIALKYLRKNESLLERIPDHLGLARNYTLWFSFDTAQRNYSGAVSNILKANLINDTILNAANTKEIKQLEVQYQSEQKEQAIKEKDLKINEYVQSDLLKEANLSRAKFTRNVTLVSSIVLLALGSILFIQYKQKRKANI
ncbi:MAG: tetratricopeptide repeat protein, partial [Sphingobacteriales bacterium]